MRRIFKTLSDLAPISSGPKETKNKYSKGRLEIPPMVNIHYGEPSIIHSVRVKPGQPLRIYEAPPKHKKSDYVGSEVLTNEGTKAHPIYKRKTKDGHEEYFVSAHEFTDVDKEAQKRVLVRPFEYIDPATNKKTIHPYLMQVATYKVKGEKVEGRPDQGNEMEITSLGYMYKEDLRSHESFKKNKGDLFPHRPRKSDIVQGEMGDCYFLAAINAILNHPQGENIIMNMMAQQPDGSVVVKMYNPVDKQPVFIRVENSEHYKEGETAVRHRAPWVSVLEKAYAGLGFTAFDSNGKYQAAFGEKGKQKYMIIPQSLIGVTGSGGFSEMAMTILTGVEANRTPLTKPTTYSAQEFAAPPSAEMPILPKLYIDRRIRDPEAIKKAEEEKGIPSIEKIKTNPDSLKKFQGELKQTMEKDNYYNKDWPTPTMAESSLYSALSGNKSLIQDWTIYTMLMKKYYRDDYDILVSAKTRDDFLQTLAAFEKNHPLAPPNEVISKFKDIKKHDAPGPVGSGIYSSKELELFDKLSDLHKKGFLLGASTAKNFDDDNSQGLLNRHAYTITDVHKKKINGKELLFVQLRNPWGGVGRVYDFANEDSYRKQGKTSCAVKDPGRPEFDIEITDFMRYFSGYSAGQPPSVEMLQKEKAILRKKSEDNLSILAVPFNQLPNDRKSEYVKLLQEKNPQEVKKELEGQGLNDLYILARHLEAAIIVDNVMIAKAKEHGSSPRIFETDKAGHTKLLEHVKKEFNLKLISSGELEQMKCNAYKDMNTKPKNGIQGFISRFTQRKDNLDLYGHHLAFSAAEKNKLVLLQNFNAINDPEKRSIFLNELQKQPIAIINRVLISQNSDDLKELERACRDRNLTNLLPAINQIKTNIVSDLRNLVNGRGLEAMSETFFRNHPEQIRSLMNNPNIESSSCSVTQLAPNIYEILIRTRYEWITKQVDQETLVKYASAQRALENKEPLRHSLQESSQRVEKVKVSSDVRPR